MNYSAIDDHRLIELIVQRNADALSSLYDRYSRLVFSIAMQLLGEQGQAEDLVIDVFTSIWEKAATYNPERAQINTWIVSIARNRAIDRLRSRRAHLEAQNVSLASVANDLRSTDQTPEQAANKRLQDELVHAAVGRLPDEQRQVILYAYVYGYTQQQIADQLGLPLGTVKTRVRLAMEKLRLMLDDSRIDPQAG